MLALSDYFPKLELWSLETTLKTGRNRKAKRVEKTLKVNL